MKVEKLLFIAFALLAFSFSASGKVPKVRFYPQPELTFCKGCFGHFGEDGWKFKIRLENLSGKDLIVYGHRFEGDDEIRWMHAFQYKNPNTCEWQYPHGSGEKRCGWECLSSYLASKIVLKAGEYIEAESGVTEENGKIPERLTAFIAENPVEEPDEIFSEPYLLVKSAGENNGRMSLKTGDEECAPGCRVSLKDSGNVRGIKLGMSLDEFKQMFPKANISQLHEDKYNYKLSWVWDWNADAYRVGLRFLNDKVAAIETEFKSLKDTRRRTDFYRLISEKIRLPYFWQPFQGKWECRDFLIEVIPNQSPTITIWNKEFLKVRDKINEEDLKKQK